MQSRFRFTTIVTGVFVACGFSGAAQADGFIKLQGAIDVSAGRFQASGEKAVTQMQSGRMTTSYWGIVGEEKLSNGLKAGFEFGQFLDATTGAQGRFNGDTAFSRGAYVYLAGDFGRVELGRNGNPLYISTLMFNPFVTSFGYSPAIVGYFIDNRGQQTPAGTNRRMVEGDTSWNSAIGYKSPRIGGFSLHAQATLNGRAAGQSGNNVGAALRYANGPVSGAFTVEKIKAEPLMTGSQTVWQLAGAYDFQTVKLFAQYGQVKSGDTSGAFGAGGLADTKGKLAHIGASVPVGAGKFLAAYGYTRSRAVDGGSAPDSSRKTVSVGYDYFLSKRTDVYTVYMGDKRSGASSGSTMVVGLRHSF